MSDTVIGSDRARRDANDKLRGYTKYTVDSGRVGMLHAAICRARLPAAKIVDVDTSLAQKMPGVHAIVTSEDAPGRYGIAVEDHPLFATDDVRFRGEPIAAVAADTLDQAQAAADAIKVRLEPLSANLTMEDSLTPGAREIHPDWRDYEALVDDGERAGNVAWEATVVRGDTESAFARDDVVVVESRFRSGRQNQMYLEPRVCIASYDDARYVIETSTQVPWAVRNATAHLLGVDPSDVRVTVPTVGGAFGGKFEFGVEPFAALLARVAGRPVRLAYTRRDEMQFALCRENAEIRIRSAVTRHGDIVAREAVVLMDCGAYGGEQSFLTSMTAHTLGGNYRLGSVRLVSRAIYTNTAPTGAFRACNGTYCTFALERHTDEICMAIKMDPFKFRRHNVISHGDMGPTGQIFEGSVLGPMLDRMVTLREATTSSEIRDDGRLYGMATVVGTWFVLVGPSAATVNINPDGGVTLVTAGVEIGSGSMMQAVPQIVADSLGIQPEDVVVRAADTDSAGYDVGVGGGRQSVSLGAASLSACTVVKEKLLAIASEMLEVAPQDLVFADGAICVDGVSPLRVSIADVAQRAQQVTGPISGSGSFTGSGTQALPGCARGHMIDALDLPVFAVHECEVAVDPDTGHVQVLQYRVVQDVGRAVNPRGIRAQIQGGVVQGLGYALHEQITIDRNGQIKQRGLENYRVPLAMDVVSVQTDLYEGAPSMGPLGVKGAGEIPILNVAAAISCAVSNATGLRVQEIPLTPPNVLALLCGQQSPLSLDHIKPSWSDNLVTRR